MATIKSLRRQVKEAKIQATATRTQEAIDYRQDPVSYIHNVLKIEYLWDKQAEILQALLKPPYRVLVKSGHNIGKTFVAACAINWWYDAYDPGVVISTAPNAKHVTDVLWKEVRTLRKRAGRGGFIGDAAPEMRTSEVHYAKGLTANVGESFQGRHDRNMLFVFDEGTGVHPSYFITTASMFKPSMGHAWLVICNPTDTTSQAYIEDNKCDADGNPMWHTVSLSSLEHPNVTRALETPPRPPVIDAAVDLVTVNDWFTEYGAESIPTEEANTTSDNVDLEWPPRSGKWFRAGPEFQSRVLGCWPLQGTYGVWSDFLWKRIEQADPTLPYFDIFPEIGADIARFGDDYTCFHARWGNVSIHHEAHNGWDLVRTCGRLRELARELATRLNNARPKEAAPIQAKQILIKVDDDGLGGGVVDILRADGYRCIGVGAGTIATKPDFYPNKRSELWFQTASKARNGNVSIALLPRETRHRLRQQAMAPMWEPDNAGRRVVEPKKDTKEKLGRSPDDMDAMNLAYMEGLTLDIPQQFGDDKRDLSPQKHSHAERRELFGKRAAK